MIGTERSPTAGPATGYFPGGSWEYRRTLERADPRRVRRVVLEFEGVYRDAVGLGERHGRRPPPVRLLRASSCRSTTCCDTTAENEMRVEATAGDDSRWYSGAGIYRNVWLLEVGAGPPRARRGSQVLTPEVDDAGRRGHGGDRRATTSPVATAALDPPHRAARRRRHGRRRTDVRRSRCSPGDDRHRPPAPARGRPAAVGARRPAPLHVPRHCSTATMSSTRTSTTFGIRTLAVDAGAGLRINGEPVAAPRCLRPPRQRRRSVPPRSTGPTSAGSSCSRRPASTPSAAPTTR